MKVLVFDLETTKLIADIGRVLVSSAYSCSDDKMYTHVIDGSKAWDDRPVIKGIRDLIDRHDMIVTWYGKGFDVPFLRTRLLKHRMNVFKSVYHMDLCWKYKGWHGVKTKNGKLDTVARFWGLKENKLVVDDDTWAGAIAGQQESLDILVDRCEGDVRLTHQVYEKSLEAGILPKSITRV